MSEIAIVESGQGVHSVMRSAKVITSIVVALAIVASACSSSTSESTTGTTISLGAERKTTSEAVKVGFVNIESGQFLSSSEVRDGAEAATAYANDHLTGIGERPIELDECKTDGTPTSSRACADQMVNDGVEVVVVGQ